MRWLQMTCPTCGEPPACLAETVAVQARLMPSPDEPGAFEYAEESQVCRDGLITVVDIQGNQNLWCARGHDWWTRPINGPVPPASNPPPAEATPMLVSWQWTDDQGIFTERVLLTPADRADLEDRLRRLEAEGTIAEGSYIGAEQATPTPYEVFLSSYEFLADPARSSTHR